MSLPVVLGIIGIVLVFAAAIVDFLLALNHRGKYWRSYTRRFGFYLLVGVLTAIAAWIFISFFAGVLIIEVVGLFACAGIYLFDNWRGKLPKSLIDHLREVGAVIVFLSFVTAVVLLMFS